MNHKRILKTAALAVAATVAFAIFAYRAAEWSRGLNSEIIVLGQGTFTTNPCSTGLTGTNLMQTTKIIPQMALGSFDNGLTKYSTIIQIVNTSGSAQNVSANFYKEDGSPLDNVTLTLGSTPITNGVLAPSSFAKDSITIISGGGTAGTGTLAWGKVTSCGSLSISTFFELRDGATNLLYSRVGVAASPANMSSFVIPRVREVSTGLDVGFALVNTAPSGTNPAVLTVELKDADGVTIATQSLSLPAGGHIAKFTKDFFNGVNDGTSRVYQYLKFTSPSPTIAAIALAIEGATQASFPVDVLQ